MNERGGGEETMKEIPGKSFQKAKPTIILNEHIYNQGTKPKRFTLMMKLIMQTVNSSFSKNDHYVDRLNTPG